MKLIHLATECMFLFKDELHKQVDGIGMGSLLGCTTANFFLGHLEMLIFKDQMSCHPKLFMFAILMKSLLFLMMLTHVRLFLNILSTTTLQFLDVDIKISEKTLDTWVWSIL